MPYALLSARGRLLAGLADGRLYASADHGDTWEEVPVRGDPLRGLRALAFADL
jgi:hypothetical protein